MAMRAMRMDPDCEEISRRFMATSAASPRAGPD
jgi:hypothetical protein